MGQSPVKTRGLSTSFHRVWFQTFHSSTESRSRLRDFSRAPTWSAVAMIASIARSRSVR